MDKKKTTRFLVREIMGWNQSISTLTGMMPTADGKWSVDVPGVDWWLPLTNIAHAWMVVEKLNFSIWCAGESDNKKWGAGYWNNSEELLVYSFDLPPEQCLSPICDSALHAICYAAVRAFGTDEQIEKLL